MLVRVMAAGRCLWRSICTIKMTTMVTKLVVQLLSRLHAIASLSSAVFAILRRPAITMLMLQFTICSPFVLVLVACAVSVFLPTFFQ